MSYIKKFLDDNSECFRQPANRCIYVVPLNIFNDLHIECWKFNRPANKDRVKVIHEHMKECKRLDGMISLAFVDNKIVCYDGNHRREALKGIHDINLVLIHMFWNATDDLISEEFKRLNKSICNSELYNPIEADILFRKKIKEQATIFFRPYKSRKSTAKNPSCGNFNIHVFCDDAYMIIKELDISIESFFDKLTQLNDSIRNRDKSDLGPFTLRQCENSDLWLFARSNRININDLR